MLEKQVETYLTKQVKSKKGMSLKFLSTITGVPDRIVILNNKLYFVELKTEKGVVSERQKIVFKQLAEQGFPVLILRNKHDIEQFIEQACGNHGAD